MQGGKDMQIVLATTLEHRFITTLTEVAFPKIPAEDVPEVIHFIVIHLRDASIDYISPYVLTEV